MKKSKHILALFCLLLLPSACQYPDREHVFTGKTMGTTYHIKVVAHFLAHPGGLRQEIDTRLALINQELSTYLPTSEISRFNRLDNTGPMSVSPDFLTVMAEAGNIFRLTGGAWDGTVKPLVDLWGFGSAGDTFAPPPAQAIDALLDNIGFEHIEISKNGRLGKSTPRVTLDLASIAKGYGVDCISRLISSHGYKNFLVEIGGEVFASGVRKDGKPWHVGINTPQWDSSPTAVYQAVELQNRAMATSGDYRNFFEYNGVRYSHIIDPRTGYPVQTGVVSASVIAGNCTIADGLATALMVMGPAAGISLVDRLADTECLIIVQNPDGDFTDHYSKGFLH